MTSEASGAQVRSARPNSRLEVRCCGTTSASDRGSHAWIMDAYEMTICLEHFRNPTTSGEQSAALLKLDFSSAHRSHTEPATQVRTRCSRESNGNAE